MDIDTPRDLMGWSFALTFVYLLVLGSLLLTVAAVDTIRHHGLRWPRWLRRGSAS